MHETHYCTCCLSQECYKDISNSYFIGNKTENYVDMLLNIFNINIIQNNVQRRLICEECVSKLRDAAAFKKKVLEIQEALKNNLDLKNINTHIMSNTEDTNCFYDFEDNLSDRINDNDYIWDHFNDDSSQKGQLIIISKGTNINKDFKIEMKETKNTFTNKIIQKDGTEILNTTDKNGEECDYNNEEGFNSDGEELCTVQALKEISKRKMEDKDDKFSNKKRPQRELHLKHKSENTLNLIQNSNLCLFRSLKNKFGCNFCQAKFPEFTQLREHSLSHTNLTATAFRVNRLRGLSCKNADISDLHCNLCSQNCITLMELMNHLKKEHEISFRGTEHYLVPYKFQDGFRCAVCELKFNTFMRLSVHMNSHYPNNVCEICGLYFTNRRGLSAHVQSQHKEKKCLRCPAVFTTNSSKIKHLRQIHGVRNSKRYCNLCNKSFQYTYMVDEHKIKDHGLKRPIFNCVNCGKTFLTMANLKTHIRSVHLKERNFACNKCEMRFFTKCDQRRHERTHDDVPAFCCSYCETKFKTKDSLRRHLKKQHGHIFDRMKS